MTIAVPAAQRRVLADLIAGSLWRDLALVLGGAALVGALAQLSFRIPGSPVPVTAQTFGVLLGGAALGWRRAAASMSLYLLAGMAGLPWFAGHGHGIAFPSLGYIVGFVAAAGLVGALAEMGGDRTPLRTVGVMAIGTLCVYAVGVPYLMADLHISLGRAISEGMTPFLLGDSLKVLLAAGVLPGAWALVGKATRGKTS